MVEVGKESIMANGGSSLGMAGSLIGKPFLSRDLNALEASYRYAGSMPNNTSQYLNMLFSWILPYAQFTDGGLLMERTSSRGNGSAMSGFDDKFGSSNRESEMGQTPCWGNRFCIERTLYDAGFCGGVERGWVFGGDAVGFD